MTPDAKIRMDVYQEGQRSARFDNAVCPYDDWRAGTWSKGREAAQAYHARMLDNSNGIPFPMNVYLRDEAELRAFINQHRHLLDA